MANPKGRPKGSPNKSSAPIRERIGLFLSNEWENIEADFKALTPNQRLQFVGKILPYVVPQMSSIDVKQATIDDLNELSNEQLNKVVNTILQNE